MHYLARLILGALVLASLAAFLLSGPGYDWKLLALSIGLAIVGAKLPIGRKSSAE